MGREKKENARAQPAAEAGREGSEEGDN